MSPQWKICVEQLEKKTLLRFDQPAVSLDESCAARFQETVTRLVNELKPRDLWFDFGSVTFISSVILGILLTLRRKLQDNNARFTLFNLRPEVFDVLNVTRLTPLFHLPIADRQRELRRRAYFKWEAAGKPPGDGMQFWLQAEKELHQAN
jgi:anti-anti-sigma factor